MIDSGALLAMVDASDTPHPAAVAFIQANATAIYYLADPIFAETMVLTKARLGAQPAIALGDRLMRSTHFQIVYLTPADRRATWDIFSRYTDKAWSYVDCSVLALAQRLNITHVFAFDSHFDQMPHFTRLPTP